MQMALLSAAQTDTSQQESEEEHLGGSKSLSRQTRESHHLSQRPSPDPVHRLTRSRGPASPRPSRAFRQPPTAAGQSSQAQPPAERRTLLTVFLAAEVAYLEGILASSLLDKAQKEERKKKRQAQRITEAHQHPAHPRQPYAQAVAPVTEKYVSQLDPFFMLDAPDLSAGGPSQGYEVGPNQRIEVEEEAESGYQLIHQAPLQPTYAPPSPQPTYGAFPLYSGPAEAPQIVTASPTTTTLPPVLLEDNNHPTPAPRKRLVRGHSRGNWGDFELYHPGGYLPTPPRKQRELSKKEKTKTKKEFLAAPARTEQKEKKKEKEGKRTTGKKEQQVEYNLVYRPSPAVIPPSPSSPISTLRGSPSTKASTAYRGGNTPPITTYKPVVHRVKSTAVSRPRPNSTLPSKSPRTSGVPSKRPATPAAVSKKPRTTSATRASVPKSSTRPLAESNIGSKRKKTSAPNLHPHTFFHEEQAKQVHKGEWPANYYNSIHNQQIKVRRI